MGGGVTDVRTAEQQTTLEWFTTAGLGQFIHWDAASQGGVDLSWPLVGGFWTMPACVAVPVAEYHAYAETFDPQNFNPKAWARQAREAGVTYAVLTTKHHSGFALWDTKLSDHSIMSAPYGRDLLREWVDAYRAEGIVIGFYFSVADWHHPDYPAYTDDVNYPYVLGAHPVPTAEQWARFREFMLGQLRELLTGYGRVDIVWFDGEFERTAEEWGVDEIRALVTELQPQALVNDRLLGHGDFATPEQIVPAQAPADAWESCITMNQSWGHVPGDTDYKSTAQLVHSLVETVGKGGNLLLNTSPRADGTFPPEQVERLAGVGRWMDAHGESVTGASAGLEAWQFYGPSTRRRTAAGERVYLHLVMEPQGSFTVRGLPLRRITSVSALNGRRLSYELRGSMGDGLALVPDPLGELTVFLPPELLDPECTVVAVDLADVAPPGVPVRFGGGAVRVRAT